jgi:iron complex outermembrane receptor protein
MAWVILSSPRRSALKTCRTCRSPFRRWAAKYLESRGVASIDALGSIAPNVKIERAPSSKTISQISIRGSVTINPAITWEPAVGLYLDGIYIAKAQGSIFDVADLERVEMLRGPQGTLYGRNALAGAVNLVTKKPSGEAGGSMELTYGSFDALKVKRRSGSATHGHLLGQGLRPVQQA